MERLGEKIKALREAMDPEMSQKDLAKRAGVSQTTIADIERGRNESSRRLTGIAAALGVTAEQLEEMSVNQLIQAKQPLLLPLADTGFQVVGATYGASDSEAGDEIAVRRMNMVQVVGEVKGGDRGFLDEVRYPAGHGEEWVPTPIHGPGAYALRVRGDSMHPRYRAGEFVVVIPSVAPKVREDVVVQFKDGRKMIKVLNWQDENEAQFLSINNGYAPMTVSLSEIASIQPVYGGIPASALSIK